MRGARKNPKVVDCTEDCGKWEMKYACYTKRFGDNVSSVFCEMKGFFKGEKCA